MTGGRAEATRQPHLRPAVAVGTDDPRGARSGRMRVRRPRNAVGSTRPGSPRAAFPVVREPCRASPVR
ncbi:hypothetical protein FHS29_005699 [Saccharothrix tamanrassetensis]|uniref:Uncharacterized protein n=1 Tax=Saccharothrix tamanrassetensis TaxID=1051531 RepID=A0A841CP53_9PSEU|nr:hypothetical protein [Saccharothrix tamanrassetensis]